MMIVRLRSLILAELRLGRAFYPWAMARGRPWELFFRSAVSSYVGRTVIDIVVTWGVSTVHVSRRTAPCSFSIGEGTRSDCVAPREALGGAACVDLLVPFRG